MISSPRPIELLSPARNADTGIEAINCGADAVYIGASAFSARSEATNTLSDIERLCQHAHTVGARVYVALNTILYDDELPQVQSMADDLKRVGVDALIVQDMALLRMNLPLPIHASTQMDNRTPSHIRFLEQQGFKRVILARELGLDAIAAIHRECPNVELEAFVHGSLCVSYSGRCYASQYCFGRSANRGACAQFCRLAFDLENESGEVLLAQKHFLSLKDMNRSQHLLAMMQAGVTSFKIEGRLKDTGYVKNITAYYRQQLDEVIRNNRQQYCRSSYGRCHINFEPRPEKSFNRGFTEYFLRNPREDVAAIHTPKSVGEPVGTVKEIRRGIIKVSGLSSFHNGDGLCFFTPEGELQGFRVNKAENNLLYPATLPPALRPHTPLYRNQDAEFEKQLSKPTPQRTIGIRLQLSETPEGFSLRMSDETGREACGTLHAEKQLARTPQGERIRQELSKLGGTGFEITQYESLLENDYFIPASQLATLRRQTLALLTEQALPTPATAPTHAPATSKPINVEEHIDYSANVANREARLFYMSQGAQEVDPAFELKQPERNALLMTCRHCIRYTLRQCPKHFPGSNHQRTYNQPLYLRMRNGRRFRLEFNCRLCEMNVYAAE